MAWRNERNAVGTLKKSASYIQPEPLVVAMDPVGSSRMKWSLNCFPWKMNIGGTEFPAADTATAMVASVPHSAKVSEPT